jgi:hypothetical protein
MNRWDKRKDSLTQEGIDRTHDQKAGDQLAKFYFSQESLYKRGRDLNIKNTLIQLQSFCFCHPAFLLPVFLTNYKLLFSQGKSFSVPSHHNRDMVHLQICWNAAKPWWPCQIAAFGSQQCTLNYLFLRTKRKSPPKNMYDR